MSKRKICFPITSRAYYGRSQMLIRKLHSHPAIDLKLMLGGSILLDKRASSLLFVCVEKARTPDSGFDDRHRHHAGQYSRLNPPTIAGFTAGVL